jgi:hypothetical protein
VGDISYILIDSRNKDLRRLNSEVISLRSGSRYVVGDISNGLDVVSVSISLLTNEDNLK